MPTKPAFLTQSLVIPQNLNEPTAFHVHNFCCARRPFPTQTTRHFPKPQQPTRDTTPKTCAKTKSLTCELALAQRGARWAEFAGLAQAFTDKNVAISARRHRSHPDFADQERLLRVVSSVAGTTKQRPRPDLPLPRTLANGLAFLFQVRLASPNLFSTFKPLTSKRVNLSRLKSLLHENTGKAIWRFLANFSAIFPNLCRACLSKIYHAFGKTPTNPLQKPPGWQARPNATVSCAGAVDQ